MRSYLYKEAKYFHTRVGIIGAKYFPTYVGFIASYISILVWKLFIHFGTVYNRASAYGKEKSLIDNEVFHLEDDNLILFSFFGRVEGCKANIRSFVRLKAYKNML